ncbi:hypothetical protein [uncultured Herbaspirillum sp.]|uniref:hypothetical protein n=1 Tax=uncultured Herbaspirillum sp. TaxID=160236 RepID=UPI00258E0FD0|nr:hypothetical protein [uncultured Herbaspirillum sp.]
MPIQLAFQDEIIRKVCESPISAKRKYGSAVALALHARLADLRAADSPIDLVELGFGKFDVEKDGLMIILLEEQYSVHVISNHRPQPGAPGNLDWSKVTRVKILSIGRTNES